MATNLEGLVSFTNMSHDIEDVDNFTRNISMHDDSPWKMESGGIYPNLLELGLIVMRIVTGAFSSVAIVCNYLVFSATNKAPPKTLKSKAFILNSVTSDMAFNIGTLTPLINSILEALNEPALRLVEAINLIIAASTQFAQLLSSVLLVVDRLYAVVKPMTYHTVGYSKLAKILMVGSAWAVAVVLVVPTFIIPFTDGGLPNRPLGVQLVFGFRKFTAVWRQQITIGVNLFVFLLYTIVFLIFILQRRMNRAVEKSTSDRAALSMTLTYFFTHLSSLCLYVPAPLFKIVKTRIPSSVMPEVAKNILNRFFVHVFVLNTVVNAYILGTRVPVIRKNLNFILKRRNGKNQPDSVVMKSTEAENK